MVSDPVRLKSLTVSVLSSVGFKEGGGWLVASSESAALTPCPGCISSDRTASEVRHLSIAACEQMVNSKQCRGVNPDYLRNCEEEEDSLAVFGERVTGCLYGGLVEGAIGLGVGAVLGKVIVGIGALMSVPVVGTALGIAAGGGAALYIYSEYDRAYQETGVGEGRSLRAIQQLLGNTGTGIYRLLLGNYECYSSAGRAWEVCGLLFGGGAVHKAAKKVTKKAATATKAPKSPDLFRQELEAEGKRLRKQRRDWLNNTTPAQKRRLFDHDYDW